MNDRLPDGPTDKSDDVQTEGNFPMKCTFGKFCPAIFVAIAYVAYAEMPNHEQTN